LPLSSTLLSVPANCCTFLYLGGGWERNCTIFAEIISHHHTKFSHPHNHVLSVWAPPHFNTSHHNYTLAPIL